jgi:hypothetical protein
MGAGIGLLADPTRRRIIAALAMAPPRPSRLAEELGLSRPAIARQLRLLEAAALIVDTMTCPVTDVRSFTRSTRAATGRSRPGLRERRSDSPSASPVRTPDESVAQRAPLPIVNAKRNDRARDARGWPSSGWPDPWRFGRPACPLPIVNAKRNDRDARAVRRGPRSRADEIAPLARNDLENASLGTRSPGVVGGLAPLGGLAPHGRPRARQSEPATSGARPM